MAHAIFFLVKLYIALLAAGFCVSGASPAPAAAAAGAQRNCPDKCGNVTIPYPFGIGPECSLPNFDLRCKEGILIRGNIRVDNITLEPPQMVAYTKFTYICDMEVDRKDDMSFRLAGSPFLVSPVANIFTAIGCNLVARIRGRAGASTGRYLAGCITFCDSEDEAAKDGAPCAGQGCCEASLAAELSRVSVFWSKNNDSNKAPTYTCQYAFVARKGWYSFSRKDLKGETFAKRFNYNTKRVVPLVLDWAIRDQICPSPPEDSNKGKLHIPYGVCISAHSHCDNASNGVLGYVCRCDMGYAGNPYKENGCTDINECESPIYPCRGGTCHNMEGDYECKCRFGRRGEDESDKDCKPIMSSAAVLVIGTTSALSITAVLLIFVRMEHEKRRLRDRFKKNGGQLLESIKIEIFRKEELDKITKNYKTIIGKGAFGEVYMGTTREYRQVAVKRSIAIKKDRQNDFVNEIQIQSQISHKYVVQLLGCCLETEVPMLVYEFVPRGSLYDVLHGKNGNGRREPLPLRIRLDIAICSADALTYMHSQACQKILHGDVKSGNILLDDEFVPKVSDFGTSRLMSIEKDHTDWVIGDSSYIDPVYMKTGLLTEKSDVYSFGIVLLELITRRKARYDGNNSLPLNYAKASMDGSAGQMYDTEILSSGEDMMCLGEVGLVAVQCLEIDVNDRPTMNEVAEKIKKCKSRWLQSH
uniref:Uncharacterized protein n=1 Tax=Avena sativa TaxID=4498 RepID=A0ACD5YZ93_AVESA